MDKRQRKAMERKFMKVAHKVMTDERSVLVELRISDIWMMISSLQYTILDPNIHDTTRAWFMSIALNFIGIIQDVHPEAAEVMMMGFDDRFHVVYKDGKPVEDEE